MALTVTSRRISDRGAQDKFGGRSYEVIFQVIQTDTGAIASGGAVVNAAAALMTGDPVPERGDTYSWDGTTDLDSYAQQYSWWRPKEADHDKVWHVKVDYLPLDTDSGRLNEDDPLLWPTDYWVDWVEEQVVLEEASNVEDLTYAAGFPRSAGTLGPVVNACGVEFTEPLMKTIYYPILNCQRFYETLDEIVALNVAFQGTTNNGTFFGSSARTAKYLTTESGKIQRINETECYAGITKIWFKRDSWDRKVLNNGWSHFERPTGNESTIIYDSEGRRAFFKNLIHDDPETLEDDDTTAPDTPCSEPLNLTLDGTLLGAEDSPVYITYRDLEEVDYSGIGIGG